MSKRKGLNLEEKRRRMLEIFFEKKDFFQLKELEKIAPKEKGVVAQSVKDVVQNLVDDGLVDTEKIGTSVYFWAFPNKAAGNRKRKLNEVESQLDEVSKKFKSVNEVLEKAKLGKEDTNERKEIKAELDELRKERDDLLKELGKYKDCDPDVLQEKKIHIEQAKEAINRWTDNIFALKSWCAKKFFIDESVLNKQFGLPEDLDYVT